MFSRLLGFLGFHRRDEPLGKILIRARVITEDQLVKALEIQRHRPHRLGRILVEENFASEFDILQAIAKYYRISAAALTDDFEKMLHGQRLSFLEQLAIIRIPIRVKLSITITFMIWLTILSLSMVILARQRDSLYAQTMRTGRVSLNYFANDAALPLLEDDILRLNSLIKESASVDGLAYASIIDRKGVVKAHTDTSLIGSPAQAVPRAEGQKQDGVVTSFTFYSPDQSHLLNLAKPISFSGVELGQANVGISLDFIDKQIRHESIYISVLSFFIVLLGIMIAVLIGVGFARPISQLVLATQEIGKGNFQYRVEKIRGDEFGDLASAFNYMSRELDNKLKMQKSFGSYVSPEILKMLMASPGESWLRGIRADVTVVFTDIRGFTQFTEAHEPEAVVEAVNEYFSIATQYIDEYGGYVDKFIGDAVLGVFGAPIARDNHAERALRAAIAMQNEFQRRSSGKNPFMARVGIGINSGVAVAGDLGSEVKKNYSVIGDSVNIASRLNSLAMAGKIIISKSTLDAAGGIIEVIPLPPAKVKGKAEPIEIFEVACLKEAKAGRLDCACPGQEPKLP